MASTFYLADDGFEADTIDTVLWNGTNPDTDNKYDPIHYTEAIRRRLPHLPYRGAYMGLIDVSLGTNDAYTESTLVTAAQGTQLWARFYLATHGMVMADNDTMTLLEVQSAGPVVEGVVALRQISGRVQVYAAETEAALLAATRGCDLLPGWHCIELGMAIDTGANNGVLFFYVDGYQIGANVTGLTQAAIAQVHFGLKSIPATATAGLIFLDDFAMDTGRIYPYRERYPEDITLTKSGCVYPGHGLVMSVSLLGGSAADGELRLYDRDTAPATAAIGSGLLSPQLTAGLGETSTYNAEDNPLAYHRGLWVELGGTEPRAHIRLARALVDDGAIRNYAARRPTPLPF